MSDRWAEYQAGTLTPPVVVQHDQLGSEHLIWVWTGTQIMGPFSRPSYDETAIVAQAVALEAEQMAASEFDQILSS